jgi:hypothetical protein
LPVLSIEPPVASATDQVTAVFVVPPTVAVNVAVAFTLRLDVCGEIEMVTTEATGVGAVDLGSGALLQAARVRTNSPSVKGTIVRRKRETVEQRTSLRQHIETSKEFS